MGGVRVYIGTADIPSPAVWRDYTKGVCPSELIVVLSTRSQLHYVLQKTVLALGECAVKQRFPGREGAAARQSYTECGRPGAGVGPDRQGGDQGRSAHAEGYHPLQ